jgi:tetratricopeptide (TPR) repeat protein
VPYEALGTMPEKIREPVIWRLKYMASIEREATLTFGVKLRMIFGPGAARMHDYDVCYSRTESGSCIVVSRVPTVFGARSNATLGRRAWAMLRHAEETTSRDEALARVREAVDVLPDTDGSRVDLLQTAASTCGRAGLFDESLSLVNRALALASESVRERVFLEHTKAFLYQETRKLDDAAAWYARAITTAETMNAPHIHAARPLLAFADLAMELGDLDAAEERLARAEATLSNTFGFQSAAFFDTRDVRAKLLRLRGDAKSAETIATEGLAASLRFELDSDAYRSELAELALARGDARAALPHLRAILQTPSRYPGRAHVYVMLARALRSLGNDTEALSALRAASALVTDVFAHDHPTNQDIERELAQLTAASPYR